MNKKIPDSLIIPVMSKHNISREEAEKRINLLFQSSILQQGHPDDPETQMLIDDFLSYDSEESAARVLLDKCVSQCLASPDFIKNYDRLSGEKLGRAMRQAEQGNPPNNMAKTMKRFIRFVEETVLAGFLASQNNLNHE